MAFCIAAREFPKPFSNCGRRLYTEAGVNLSVQACWALAEGCRSARLPGFCKQKIKMKKEVNIPNINKS
jgi:hypothetical protein